MAFAWVTPDFEWHVLGGAVTGRATGLKGVVQFTQVWHFDEHGVPVRVRERLDDYFLEGVRKP